MRKLIFMMLVTLAFQGCQEDRQPGEISGTYEGVFGRSQPNARYRSSAVTLTFDMNTFSGTSEFAKYPAICRGSYDISGSSIVFRDSCIWTADFDWSLILSGNYRWSAVNDQLTLTRTLGTTTDTYRLTKK